jgi:hypothetical protein
MSIDIATNAQEIFQAAYENRYTWDENFPGYTAELSFKQSDSTYNAQITVNSEFLVEVDGISEQNIKELVTKHIADIATHRRRSAFGKAHGKNSFAIGKEIAGGTLEILVSGEAMGNNYQITGKVITQVNRQMGGLVFTIDTEAVVETEEGYLPSRYQAIFRDATTQSVKATRYHIDSYEKSGKYYIPSHQSISTLDGSGQKIESTFQFSNIQLLETK